MKPKLGRMRLMKCIRMLLQKEIEIPVPTIPSRLEEILTREIVIYEPKKVRLKRRRKRRWISLDRMVLKGWIIGYSSEPL